jgi:hypothetical protein
VILEIPRILGALLPDRFASRALNVAWVQTTRPKFLVFDGHDCRKPLCVVQFGEAEELQRTHGILQCLHRMLPDVVPDSLAFSRWRDVGWVHVQEGAPGLAWFRLADRFRSRRDWVVLRRRAVDVLVRFQEAVRKCPKWRSEISPGDKLRNEATVCLEREVGLSQRVWNVASRLSEELDVLGRLASSWQHGDYCLNNLLVDDSRISIIDFEEFGTTSMPLQDELGLALSTYLLAPRSARTVPLCEHVQACVENAIGAEPALGKQIPGLFLYYLLRRVNFCHGHPTRARVRRRLIKIAESVTKGRA